jgi:hypothetical protein
MNITKSILSLAFAMTLCGASFAGNHTVKERHPELQRALRALQKSRTDLMNAKRDFGGHRTKAVQAVDVAIDEIKQALAYAGH